MLSESLRFDAAFSYNDTKADGDSPYFEDGEEIYGKPKYTGNIALNGEYNLSNDLRWGWYAAASYRDDISTGNESRPELGDYTLLDASVTLYGDSWLVSLYGENLGNEQYETSYSSSEYRNRLYTGQPRTMGLRLSYDF
jgi:outer membrane receptor protein involved in Fe transport